MKPSVGMVLSGIEIKIVLMNLTLLPLTHNARIVKMANYARLASRIKSAIGNVLVHQLARKEFAKSLFAFEAMGFHGFRRSSWRSTR